MKRIKKTSLSFMVVGAVLLGLVAALLAYSQASAASGTVKIGTATVAPGAQGTVNLEALDVTAPGMGAWTVDISYDSQAVTAVSCNPQQGVCNTDYAEETVRFTGASANGLEGDTTIGSVTFECGETQGSSVLGLTLQVFADATLGAPVAIDATVENGSIACVDLPTPGPTNTPGEPGPTSTPQAPTSTPGATLPTSTPATDKGLPIAGSGGGGFGPGGGGTLGWLIAGLAGAGIAWLVAGLAGAGLAVASSSGAAVAPAATRAGDRSASASSRSGDTSTGVPRWLRLAPPPRLVKPDTFKPPARSE